MILARNAVQAHAAQPQTPNSKSAVRGVLGVVHRQMNVVENLLVPMGYVSFDCIVTYVIMSGMKRGM